MENMDWVDLAQNRDRWGALINAVKNLGFQKNLENFLIN